MVFFNPLFDRLQSWLAGWKTKFLSLGGRLQLIRSSVNSYLTYWFGSMAIPEGIIKKICSFTAKFFYHSGEEKKLYTISWACTTLPKDKGGISLLSVSFVNVVCKLKMTWRICTGNSLLAKWCRSKYISIWNPNTYKSSSLWKTLKLVAHRFKDKFSYQIGGGQDTSLIYDPWCGNTLLFNSLGPNGMSHELFKFCQS